MKLKKEFLGILIYVLFHNCIYAQKEIDSIIYALKVGDYNRAVYWAKNLENNTLKTLFLYEINYYRTGKKEISDPVSINVPFSRKDSIIFYYLKGNYYKIQKTKVASYNHYHRAYELVLQTYDHQLKNHILNGLIECLVFNKRDDTLDIKEYVQELKKHQGDISDRFWYTYRAIQTHFLIKDFKQDRELAKTKVSFFKKKEMSNLFDTLKQTSKNNRYHRALFHKLLSVYQADWLEDYSSSNKNLIRAKTLFLQIPYYQSQDKVKGIDFNRGVNYFKNKEYRKAISLFKENLRRNKEDLYLKNNYSLLNKVYDKINLEDSAKIYLRKRDSIRNKIENASADINMQQKKNMKKKIELEKDKNKELQNQIFTILPILGLITLILIVIFYLYKRYKKKSTVLEEEQSETLQKLDELKQIVIKNHIVLKDKTKVYITDLMYIQSDDHYLKVFTQDGKNRFVRGKLSQLKEELPPNFIQCHRSYIVNRNFIKQIHSKTIVLINKEEIPLSRTYKDTL